MPTVKVLPAGTAAELTPPSSAAADEGEADGLAAGLATGLTAGLTAAVGLGAIVELGAGAGVQANNAIPARSRAGPIRVVRTTASGRSLGRLQLTGREVTVLLDYGHFAKK